jgi:pimeloyl-ACP methyl ester carboxylesterase
VATFVLVHGAWHGGWCWQRVRCLLLQRGHAVYTPTLTGVGARSHLLSRSIDLSTHTLDIVNLIEWEDLNEVVLCGHSYGGMVVAGVADRIPERVRALVYLDAFVLGAGDSLDSYAPIPAELIFDEWKVRPITAEAFGVNPADRAWVDGKCTLHPLASFREPLTLTGGLERIPNVSYVYASGWAGGNSPFHSFYEKAQSQGWKTHEINCGHDVMIDEPEALAALLLESA